MLSLAASLTPQIQFWIPNPALPPLPPPTLPLNCLRSTAGPRLTRSGEVPFTCTAGARLTKSGEVPPFTCTAIATYGECIPGLTILLAPLPPVACLSFRAANRLNLHSFVSGFSTAHFGHSNSVVSVFRNAATAAAGWCCSPCPSSHHRSIQ